MDYIQGLEYVIKLLNGFAEDLDIQIENVSNEIFNLNNDLQVYDVEHNSASENKVFSPRKESLSESGDERAKLVRSINYFESYLESYKTKKKDILESISFLKDTTKYMKSVVSSKDLDSVKNRIDNIEKYILSDPYRASVELSSLSKKLDSGDNC